MRSVTPFLMFTGRAEEALTFYAATFPRAHIASMARYGAEGPGPAGSVRQARLMIGELELIAFDSWMQHAFGFTPAISFFVDCDSPDELRTLAASLMDGGQVMMPVDRYDFAELFAWVSDRFGVSWQLNLRKG